jgi:hypothetical protein
MLGLARVLSLPQRQCYKPADRVTPLRLRNPERDAFLLGAARSNPASDLILEEAVTGPSVRGIDLRLPVPCWSSGPELV